MATQPHILIAGAGPTGIVCALGLAQAGLRVTVLEAENTIIDSPRAPVYHWAVLDGLSKLGLLPDLLQLGFTNRYVDFLVSATGERLRMDIGALEGQVPHPYNLHLGQSRFAELGVRHLLRHPNAQVLWGHRVEGVEQNAQGVTAQVRTRDGVRTLQGDWLIGADGGRGAVRDAIGQTLDGMTWPERFVAVNLRYDYSRHGYAPASLNIDPQAGCIVAEIDKTGLWRCTYSEDPSLPEDQIEERMHAFFKRHLPGPELYAVVAYSPYRMHQRCVGKMRQGRVLLAGDAAHITNPTGGLGLTGGLFDAYVLIEALAAVATGQAPDNVLDLYCQERRDIYREVTAPRASQLKRLVFNSDDAAALEQGLQGLRQCAADPALQCEVIHRGPLKLETSSVLPGRRGQRPLGM